MATCDPGNYRRDKNKVTPRPSHTEMRSRGMLDGESHFMRLPDTTLGMRSDVSMRSQVRWKCVRQNGELNELVHGQGNRISSHIARHSRRHMAGARDVPQTYFSAQARHSTPCRMFITTSSTKRASGCPCRKRYTPIGLHSASCRKLTF